MHPIVSENYGKSLLIFPSLKNALGKANIKMISRPKLHELNDRVKLYNYNKKNICNNKLVPL